MVPYKKNDFKFDKNLLTPPAAQVPLNHILATSELDERVSREPDYLAEAEALAELASDRLKIPKQIFNKLSEIVMRLCDADSAGVSIAETEDGKEIFRWQGVAGEMEQFQFVTMPRYFSPCGVVTDSKSPQLMKDLIKHYQYVSNLGIPIYEVLLVPYSENSIVLGTVWLVAHTPHKKFDREDLRILTSLSQFASIAVQTAKQRAQKNELG